MSPSGRRLLSGALLWLLVGIGCGGTRAESEGGASSKAAASPLAHSLHGRLFDAADQSQVAEFKSILTTESVRMMDDWFTAQARALHVDDGPETGWPGFVALHAALPPSARDRAPYPVVGAGSTARLDLTAHPDAEFFRAATLRLQQAKLIE
ncbi:MAG: hypothetical protein ACI9OJ_000338 [Myxococcota bacterium]